MQAILVKSFVSDPSTLPPTQIPIPQPTANEYLVRVTHCGPQHADILHAQGTHQNVHAKKGSVHPPFVPGYDFAGIIEQAPSNATLQKGDRVFGAGIGAFAEYVTAKTNHVRKIPDGVSSKVACALSGQAVSYAAVVHVAKVKRGETVLVSGASGGLGSACCMVAKALGARVIALAGDERKAAAMRRDMDVDRVVVASTEDDAWTQQVLEFTEGKGVDAVLDNTGMVNQAVRCVAYGGTIVILGFAARHGVMEEVKTNRLLLKGISLIGYRFGESGRRFPNDLEMIWEGYLRMVAEGKLQPLLYGQYEGLESIGRALKDLAERKVYGKIVVSVSPTPGKSRL